MNLNKEVVNLPVPLGTLSPGQHAEINSFNGANGKQGDELQWRNRFLYRLHEMGFIPGERVEILNEAPLSGDPITVRIRNGVYAMRREDANSVLVFVRDEA